MKIDTYSLKARYFPAILSILLPILIFNHFYTSEILADFVDNTFGAKIISNLSISTIALFLLSQVGRIIGKVFEQMYFNEESNFYTTKYLTFKDSIYPESYKKKIALKIQKDFSIQLKDQEAEIENYSDAVSIIIVAVRQVRKKLFKNKFLLQHNIEYGFSRNLVGGSVLGIVFCLWNIFFFSQIEPVLIARNLSITLGSFYLILIFLGKPILQMLSKAYAKILFREYMP